MAQLPPGLFPGQNQKVKVVNSRLVPAPRAIAREIMASPPSTTLTTSHTISSPKFWNAFNWSGTGTIGTASAPFSYFRAGAPSFSQTGYPKYIYANFSNIDYNSTTRNYNSSQISFIHYGSAIEIYLGGYNAPVWVRVDGQYISATPFQMANDGGLYYYYIPFGSSASRRIDVIVGLGANGVFGGVYTAATDTVLPAPQRGPTAVYMGDSFVEGTLATYSAVSSFLSTFSDWMGWDNIIQSGVGGTGIVATDGGLRPNYAARIATDVIPYNPEIVFVHGSINDAGYTGSVVLSAWQSLKASLHAALPNAVVAYVGPFTNHGAGYITTNVWSQHALIQADCASDPSCVFVDMLQQPLSPSIAPFSSTINASATAGATTISTVLNIGAGNVIQFPDGTEAEVLTNSVGSPFTATIDHLQTNQSSGAVITQVGRPVWSGAGYQGATTGVGNCDVIVGTDGTHPTQAGHDVLGDAVFTSYRTATAPN